MPSNIRLFTAFLLKHSLAAVALLLTLSAGSLAQSVVERGKFIFYELKQAKGEESYEIKREGNSLLLTSKLEMALEEGKAELGARLRLGADLTPEQFELKGTKPSKAVVDMLVEINGRDALVREGKEARRLAAPERFFTLSGYAPVSAEMMFIRYALANNVKGPVKLLPGGEARVESRGADMVTINGKQVALSRFAVSGVSWGREMLWVDSEKRLVAITGIGADTEENNLQAVREGYDSALPFFIKRTAEDGVEWLSQLADNLSPRRKGPLALVGATLIDGTGTAPVADSVVLIEGDRITAAGPRSLVKVPTAAEVYDARGKFIVPGLWDMHAHVFQPEFMPVYLAAGITTVRDVGNEFEFVTTLRDATRQGRGMGPRMLLAGYINGKNDYHAFDIQVETPEEARAAVRRYKAAGFEQIKVRQDLKLEALRAVTDESHKLGMTVTGHVPNSMNAIEAVEAGMDQINHLHFIIAVLLPKGTKEFENLNPINFQSEEAKTAIEVFKRRGTVIDPTMGVYELEIHSSNRPISSFEPGFAKLPPDLAAGIEANNKGTAPEQAAGARAVVRQFLSAIAGLHKAGIPIIAGTDNAVLGHSLHRELELYVQAGMTPMEAIQAATVVPARAMRADKEVGTIEVGKRADLILLDANPLESISNIRKVKSVVAAGRVFDSAALWRSVGFQP